MLHKILLIVEKLGGGKRSAASPSLRATAAADDGDVVERVARNRECTRNVRYSNVHTENRVGLHLGPDGAHEVDAYLGLSNVIVLDYGKGIIHHNAFLAFVKDPVGCHRDGS